jgi:hypothetical protein
MRMAEATDKHLTRVLSFTLLWLVSVFVYADTFIPDELYIPDPELNPGAINPDVTQQNLSETVCDAGWTANVRPSSSYARRLKARQMHERNLPGKPNDYREDHRVPLCAGGHPRDARNLWPQPFKGKFSDADKNALELSVCRQLCRGDISLEAAQAIFLAPDWREEYNRFFTPR